MGKLVHQRFHGSQHVSRTSITLESAYYPRVTVSRKLTIQASVTRSTVSVESSLHLMPLPIMSTMNRYHQLNTPSKKSVYGSTAIQNLRNYLQLMHVMKLM